MKLVYYNALFCIAALIKPLDAAGFVIEVISPSSQPLSGAVVYLEPLATLSQTAASMGVMDQIDRQFSPHILVVQRGTDVAFPNSDSIKHHVYSFSESKVFELKLYNGSAAEPIAFDQAGEVELGCNVHDWMLGYIYVVDTPFFGRTDELGQVTIDAPPGRYQLGVWHPRIQDDPTSLTRQIGPGDSRHRIQLAKPLLAPYDPESVSEFGAYD